MSLKMKYFVLKPEGDDPYSLASRKAMISYALAIRATNPQMAEEVIQWVSAEAAKLHVPSVRAEQE